MIRSLPRHSLLWLLLSSLLLTACTSSSPALRAGEDATHEDTPACDDPDADQCVVLACDEGECGFFGCEDVDPEALAHVPLAHGVELAQFHRPPFRGPGTQRNWRRAGLREDARPRMTFHFRYRQGYLPALKAS